MLSFLATVPPPSCKPGWDGILGVERSREQCEGKRGSQSGELKGKEVSPRFQHSLVGERRRAS